MKKLLFYSTLLVMGTSIGCTSKTTEPTDNGIELANLDTSVVPGNDFYQYATGGWQSANPIPNEYSRYGTFDKLRENNQEQVQGLIEELGATEHKHGTNAQKVGDLYSMGIDSVKLNADGYAPIKPILADIEAATTKKDIVKLMAQLSRYASNPFFGFYVGADDKNSSMNIAHIYQSGIGMGEREYYLEQNDKANLLRQEYVNLMKTQFQNIGYTEAQSNSLDRIYYTDFNLSTGLKIEKTENYATDEIISNTKRKVMIRPLPKIQDIIPFENDDDIR